MTVTVYETPEAPALTDAEIDRWRPIPVAVAADLAKAEQIDPAIRPLNPAGRQAKLIGRAATALCEPPDFGAVLHAGDRVRPGDVLMIAAGGSADWAMIGEIVSGYLKDRGGVGVVCDGAVRDVGELATMSGFSVFTRHITPRGPSGVSLGVAGAPVAIGGRVVTPGDLVIGDDDGLIALAPDTAREIIDAAEAKVALEERWVASLNSGRSMAETFDLPAATIKKRATDK